MIREAILKRDKKSRALFILCMALYAAAFAGAIRSLIVFHWMGAFVMFIRLVKTVLMVPLPMLLATIIMLRICNSAPWRRAAANICWWYLFSVYFIILCFVLLGGFRREYDYTYLAPNYIPFATLHSQFANLFTISLPAYWATRCCFRRLRCCCRGRYTRNITLPYRPQYL